MISRVPVRWLQLIPEETIVKVSSLRDIVIRDALSVFCLEYNNLVNELSHRDLRTSDAMSDVCSTLFRFGCKIMDVRRQLDKDFRVYKIWEVADAFLEGKEKDISRCRSSLWQRALAAMDDEHDAERESSLLEPTVKSDPAPVDYDNFYSPPTIGLSALDLDIQAVNSREVKERLERGEKPTEHSLDLAIWSVLQVKRQWLYCSPYKQPSNWDQSQIVISVIDHGAKPTGHTLDLAIAANYLGYYTIKHIVDVYGHQLKPTPISLDLAIENLECHNLAYFMARGATPTPHTLSLAKKHDKSTLEMVTLYIQYFANIRKYARAVSQATRDINSFFSSLPRNIALEIAVHAADGLPINHAILTSTQGYFAHRRFQSCALISPTDIAIQASASTQMAERYFSKPH